jgi:hypothetical protein
VLVRGFKESNFQCGIFGWKLTEAAKTFFILIFGRFPCEKFRETAPRVSKECTFSEDVGEKQKKCGFTNACTFRSQIGKTGKIIFAFFRVRFIKQKKMLVSEKHSRLLSQFSAIFTHFRRKKLAFFSKTNVMMKILHNLALF